MEQKQWGDKPYYSLDSYLKNQYGEKVYKVSLNGGMTCPNRDGTLDTRGCIFCSEGGSGEFTPVLLPVQSDRTTWSNIGIQIEQAKLLLSGKQAGKKYIAYFQAYTNTYASVEYLHEIFTQAIEHPDVVGISIATRPDCVSDEVIELLAQLNLIKPVWIELGLQTIHENTANMIRRGYDLVCFEEAVGRIRKKGLDIIVHLILGLPGETKAQMLASISYINGQEIQGVKLQLLHILKNTDLAKLYEENPFHVFTLTEYADILCDIIAHLSPKIVIHRITGDGPKRLLMEPKWSGNKKNVLNTIHKELKVRGIYQGSAYRLGKE